MAELNLAALQAAVTDARAALAQDADNKKLQAALDKAVSDLAAGEAELAAAIEASKKEVRILADKDGYKADTVERLLPDDAAIAVRDGWADDDETAVAFAKKEAAKRAEA